jgi:phosphoribosylamine--glycine ligase
MNVLVIGGGGREHAITWKLKKSTLADKIYCSPGNGGIMQDAEAVSLSADFNQIGRFIDEKNIDLLIVGPELPLVHGIADYFKNEKVAVFGPSGRAAMLEGSKVFSKNFMRKYSVPTAGFEVFEESSKALDYLSGKKEVVIKADGLCAGKGVVVADDFSESSIAIRKFMDENIFGVAGSRVVVEEKLKGEEASILVLISGDNYSFLIPSQDHKAAFEGDKGPNTGGMGAYAPTSLITEELLKRIDKKIMNPIMEGLKKEGLDYSGVLYLGLMLDGDDINVLEFNVRFGDPEAQVIFPMMENDLLEVILQMQRGEKLDLQWKQGCCVDVVLASEGYPGNYPKGRIINIDNSVIPEDVCLFHAGTEYKGGNYYTTGGRVLNVSAVGSDIANAREKVYNAISNISFDGMHYRKDIGMKEIARG